jgi:HTH-type transcriptional regulator, sugar sensing transcriptional regulator
MIYAKELEDIGLSKTEARVYLTSLSLGESLYAPLAEKAGVKRASLYYDVLPKLLGKGLVTKTRRGKRTYIVPQDLNAYLEEKKKHLRDIEEILPELQLLLAGNVSKPKILLYEGIDGIKRVWNDHLKARGEICEFIGIENIHPELSKYVKEHYIWERAKRNIPLRMILSGPSIAGVFNVKSDPYEKREVRKIDGKLYPIPLGMDVYDDTIAITLHRKDSEPIGLLIRSREIAATIRSIFNFIWLGVTKESGV